MVSNKLEKESLFAGTKDGRPWSSFMFPNDHNIKWTQIQSKHGICPKLGALGKYSQFISMNKSIANWNYLFVGIEQGLIQQSASTSSQSYSHSKDRFFQKKRERRIFSIKGLGTRGIGLVLLRLLKKKNINQNFQFLEKIQDFQIFQKKKNHQSKISIPSKNLGFPKIFKKTKKFKSPKKKSSLNSSSGTESYDSFPHSPVMQHQVNCPPSAFIEAWSMSQTRGIRQVCQSLFNE